ncbi:MAG: hypothetical protein FI729_01405 [SAR202 cluster bacterium]|nr:hypothetical protein [SAR202 cluster bacterium]|tara:strand:- start:4175 stop:5869 length:1695 start_codon:yes stop_codon:yes gene_type:complete
MFKIADRVKESTLSTGTGSVVLAGAYAGFDSFANGIGDGNTTYYTIENFNRWEVGIGTYTASTSSLSRDVVLKSSSGAGIKINLEGSSIVFCTLPADRAFIKNPDNDIESLSGVLSESGIFNKLIVKDDLTVNDSIDVNSLSATGISTESINISAHTETESLAVKNDTLVSGLLTLAPPDDSGCFIHAYRSTLNDKTVALHMNNASSPLWKLGLKSNNNHKSDAPDHGYVYGIDGSAGVAVNNNNYTEMSSSAGLFTYHDSHVLLRASSATGVYIDGKTAAYPVLTVQGAAGQSEDLQRWETSAGIICAQITNNGDFLTSGDITSASGQIFLQGGGSPVSGPTLCFTGSSNRRLGFYEKQSDEQLSFCAAGRNKIIFGTDRLHVNNEAYIGWSSSLVGEAEDSSDLNLRKYASGVMSVHITKGSTNNLGEILASGLTASGVELVNHVPVSITNRLYNDGGTLKFNGSAVSSSNRTHNSVTSNFSMSDNSDVVFMDTSSSPLNVYLPTAVDQGGKELIVKMKAGSNSGVLVASGSQTIDGESQFALKYVNQSITLISDNSNWFIT